MTFRGTLALVLSAVLAIAGIQAQLPGDFLQGGVMVGCEYLLGYVMGVIPQMVLGALAVSGQVISASIGLGQATLIDPSLGEQVSVLSKLQSMIGVSVFLLIDGHHVVLRAASQLVGDLGVGLFRPGDAIASILVERFSHAFEVAVLMTGPVLVTILVTQFVLGLLTKFVPQVNVFIVSMPLTIGVGLFLVIKTMPAMTEILVREYSTVEEFTAKVMTAP